MRLTSFTDYALRLLIFAAGHDERVTIEQVAGFFGISHAHLKKVVLKLSRAGFIVSTKGRNGGLALARRPSDINVADVVLATEPDFGLFECLLSGNDCRITRACRLPGVANEALDAFLTVLRRYTLADVLVRPAFFLNPPDGPQPFRGRAPNRTEGVAGKSIVAKD